ncbi:hypothetical protein M378DRAFT_198312 [Amanita muscaria Koide BX008]|uniref:DUF6534 domain-containing protein n=1 Tax=Amanita muscaria (strain Koide BX008) TaxID=946122 RepID=A0A0C2WSU8_AMAMK|nr:hypothetical protein M378DRAFT_198312 [Amanita muscaria Koide BX008]
MSPYGALLLGALFASQLTGITIAQTVLYFKLFPDDDKLKKTLVIVVWILDIVHTVFIWKGMWFYFVDNFGDISKLQVIPLTGIFTAITTMLAHFFYVSRIFRRMFSFNNMHLSYVSSVSQRKYWLVIPILIFAVCRVAVGCVTSGQMFRLKGFPEFISRYLWLLSFGLALSCIVDMLIMTSMFALLWQSRKHSKTSLVDALLLHSLEIGSLTGCATIVTIVIWLVLTDKVVFLGLYFIIAKFYANSLLAALNARYQLRRTRIMESSQSWQNWRLGTRFLANDKEIALPPTRIDPTNIGPDTVGHAPVPLQPLP